MMKITPLTVFFLSATFVRSAQLLTFDFAGNAGDELTAGSNANALGVQSSTMSRGSALLSNGGVDSFNARAWSTSDVLYENAYFEFTVNAAAGYQVTVNNIEIPQHQRSLTGPVSFSLRHNLDGYASDLATFSNGDVTNQRNNTFEFADIHDVTSVTFRIYGYEAGGSQGTWRLGPGAGNDLVVNGTVNPIPEPSSAVLALAGFFVFVRRRR